jgi:ferric-dicitrate binding protein FerR (iron transport regulator)
MSRDQRILLLMHGGTTGWERIATWCELAVSPSARASYRSFGAISAVLRASLADPDDLISVKLPKRRAPARGTRALLLLAALTAIAFLEWRQYTVPALAEAIQALAHRCGIR